jgi:hypothetical protein
MAENSNSTPSLVIDERLAKYFDLLARIIIVASFIMVPTGRLMLSYWNQTFPVSLESLLPYILAVLYLFVSIVMYRLVRKARRGGIRGDFLGPLISSVFIMCVPFLFVRMEVALVHAMIFGSLGISSRLAVSKMEFGQAINHASLVVIIIGVADEVAQYFWPTRFFDSFDILLNCVTGVCGVLTASLWCKRMTAVN